MHRATSRFWILLARLPEGIQGVARKNFELLKADPSHPSLPRKKVGKIWSIRPGINHRDRAVEDGQDFVWFWIGPHDEYTG